jgi:lipopolysaccharide cholinephosphotransferase
MLVFPEGYFKNEVRCGFHITSMVKRLWASQMEFLSWVDEVCRKYDIRYILCYGSLIGAVRHKGYIPWDDDLDVAMLRGDYEKFLSVVPSELPPYFYTTSLLPGAIPPKEMTFKVGNGNRLDTSPEFLDRFHGCPYATGIDVFVFDRVPDNPQDRAYQDRLVRMLDRMLMLQWEVDDATITGDRLSEYKLIKKTVEEELAYEFTNLEPMKTQVLRLLDLACGICEDCGSTHVENREQVIYYGELGLKEEYFTDRIWIPFEGMIDVPIPRSYDEFLRKVFGDYQIPKKFTSQHDYPIYHNQRDALYQAYKDRGWKIPEEFLEYDENGQLIGNPF